MKKLEEYTVVCMVCKQPTKIKIDPQQLRKWTSGERSIQAALPSLTAGERELLISKICEPCYDKMFEGEDE